MTMTDPIADMLTRIRNAQMAGHKKVKITNSKLKVEIAKILVQEGFVKRYEIDVDNKFPEIEIKLKYYDGNKPVILGLQRESTPGRRKYVTKNNIPRVRNNYGIAVISTSMGIMTGMKAEKIGIGGEYLCSIW